MLYGEFLTGTDTTDAGAMFDTYEVYNHLYMDNVFKSKEDVYTHYQQNKDVIDYAVSFFREKLRQEEEIKERGRVQIKKLEQRAADADLLQSRCEVVEGWLSDAREENNSWVNKFKVVAQENSEIKRSIKILLECCTTVF
jgi:hypothetical protein